MVFCVIHFKQELLRALTFSERKMMRIYLKNNSLYINNHIFYTWRTFPSLMQVRKELLSIYDVCYWFDKIVKDKNACKVVQKALLYMPLYFQPQRSKYRFIKSIWAYERALKHGFQIQPHTKRIYASVNDKFSITNNYSYVAGWVIEATKRELVDIGIKSNSPFFGECVTICK